MGDARIVAAAKEIAARRDAQAVVDRAAKAEADRTVTIRPAPDCMTYVTVLLPVAHGVGVYAALTSIVEVMHYTLPRAHRDLHQNQRRPHRPRARRATPARRLPST